jgi:hypothetical protein
MSGTRNGNRILVGNTKGRAPGVDVRIVINGSGRDWMGRYGFGISWLGMGTGDG